MLASETRKLAREALAGKWGKAALLVLIYFLLSGLLSIFLGLIPIAGSIANMLLEIPLTFGLIVSLLKLKRGEDVTYTEFFKHGIDNFGSSWMVSIWTFVKLLIPSILVIIALVIFYVGFGTKGATINGVPVQNGVEGVSPVLGSIGLILLIVSSIWLTVKSYYYKITFFILADNTDKDPKEVVAESERLMEGNRGKFFCLELSFIGWIILATFTFGIGFLFLFPYVMVAEICFYEYLAGKATKVEAEVVEEKPAEE